MANNQADLPKRNAVPAEAPKSLAATVQQVLTKAVTHPSDPKSDFAQGVKHITGDPHQKSAGQADAAGKSLKAENTTTDTNAKDEKGAESLKASADKVKDKEHPIVKEAEEKKDEKEKEVKETEDKKENDKEKETVKEGELPAALQKAIDKKKEDAKESDEKKDEKKKEDVKESDEKDSDEKKKEDVKETEDKKEDEKKAEVKEDAAEAEKEKEVKKENETAKDKVKNLDMKEDVKALTEGEDLSEEFKAKAATIFESAVKAKLVEEIEKLEGEYETKVAERVEETKSEIVEKVDAYLNYVVEEWMKENELAIEKGLRAEITEDFIGGLKTLFESHYINVPSEKYDVIESQAAEIEKLKEENNKSIEKSIELNQKVGEFTREGIINDVSSDLAETETEKLKGLAEGIEYKDADSFRKSIETLKDSYFPKAEASDKQSNEVADNDASPNLSESMAAYTAAISKTKKNPYLK
tara:strand:+ start:1743 stop:3152 length:1410 start_codon:yes stop_codon:yes gene_type:complete